ncbi:heparin-sulfate lyase HepC [Alistipes senegalensis]|uniref:Heparinase II/III family protein n=1 Tax=Alistipes senegalensis JC50 TaxID=1033732 RepID=A0ABY5V4T4_9BACT|nr:heparin-sulfate lyase HepC [Alistipes senegalensis]UEA87773.1 heparinase II/III family protein [Alistipes senegalensis]UWN64637.1 heparinase II/III family protein [Alistipes senegalensis JC50]
MKRIFTEISAFGFIVAVLFSAGCLSDDLGRSDNGSGTGSTEPTIPDNSVIEAGVFSALNLDYPGLAAVKAYYESDQYYLAAQALLEYYRGRTDVVNGNVNLIAPSISAEEQVWADQALLANEYRFYVEGYMDGDVPYSYLKSRAVDWTVCPTGDLEQRYRVHRHQWMVPQGKAYRTSLDETYASEWVTVYEDWLGKYPRPTGDVDYDADPASQPEESREALYAWRPADVACRVEAQCDLLYYFMQSTSFTPQLLSKFLTNLAEQAEHVRTHYSEDVDTKAAEAHAVFRAGTIFPEMKRAEEWVESGSGSMNEGIDASVFEVLNLDYSGLTKVKRAYDIGDYYMALEELMNYYRSRTHGLNPNVDLSSVTPTANEQRWADYALRENDYRFYVNNYFDPNAGESNVPYSYLNSEGTGIDWTIWPTREQEQRYQLHRHQWMVPQAKTYYASADEKYALNWIEVYGDWLKQNPKPEQGTDVTNHASWRPLDVAARLIDQCALLEYYQQSPSVTVEWLAEVLTHLDEHANHIMNNYSTTSNHLITQAQAVTFAGMLFPELKNASAWKQSGTSVLSREVTAQYFPDGWLMDGDLHYHISGIEDFRVSLEVAQRNGEESRFPENYVESMRKMTDVVMNMIYPDYTVPNMADTRRATWTASVLRRNLTNYYNLFPDNQQMLWMATGGAEGTMPETKVKTFPDGGYYVMRSGWTTSDMMMVLQNTPDGPSEQWHRQYDNNTFELWVKGRNFFPDSGCFSYGGTSSSNADRRKYAASTAHNTVTLGDANVSSDGKLLKEFSRSGSGHWYEALVLENPSYEGLTHRRTIFMVDDKFYVILDEAYGTAAGTVNLNFNITEGDDSQVVYDPEEGGFHTAFSDGNNLLVRTRGSKTGAFVKKTGFVSYNINQTAERKAYQLNLEKTADEPVVRYATVLLPTSDASAETVVITLGDWSENGGSVRVQVGGVSYPALSYTL